MKKFVLGLAAVSCLAVAGGALAANTDSATSSATIIIPLTLTDGDSLDFGSIATNGTDCTATVSPAVGLPPGAFAFAGVGNLCHQFGGSDDSDWETSGEPTFDYTLTLSGVTDLTGPAIVAPCTDDTLEISDFTVQNDDPDAVGDLSAGPVSGNGLNAGGTDDFAVGATINIVAAQCPGLYGGVFTLTATYP
jgi:hypothetical protein